MKEKCIALGMILAWIVLILAVAGCGQQAPTAPEVDDSLRIENGLDQAGRNQDGNRWIRRNGQPDRTKNPPEWMDNYERPE